MLSRNVAGAVLLSISWFGSLDSAGAQETSDPLGFLEPLIGTWIAAPEWTQGRAGMEDLVPIAFEWGPSRISIVEHSGLPTDGQLFTMGLIAWNPVTRRAEFVASQGRDGLYFEGWYELDVRRNIRRIYDVRYPDGNTVRYRETFFPIATDTIDWLTEWEQGGRFVPRRGDGSPEFRAVRSSASQNASTQTWLPWIGEWEGPTGRTISIASLPNGLALDLVDVATTGARVSGRVVWDPHVRLWSGTHTGGGGNLLRSTWTPITEDQLTMFVREYRSDGTIDGWSEHWTLDSEGNCIERSRVPKRDPSVGGARYCRAVGR